MAVYVKMIKKFDDEKRVVYQFGPNEKQMGEIEFDKEKKIFNILNQVNDSRISNQAYENWASEQILKIMFRNDGQFPDVQSKSDLKSWLVKAGDKKKGFSLESKKRMMMQKR